MKRRIVISTIALVTFILFWSIDNYWHVECDTDSGRTRTVFRWCFITFKQQPKNSKLTDWLQTYKKSQNWVIVKSLASSEILISYCFDTLIARLHSLEITLMMDGTLSSDDEKSKISKAILTNLASGRSVCDVLHRIDTAIERIIQAIMNDTEYSTDDITQMMQQTNPPTTN